MTTTIVEYYDDLILNESYAEFFGSDYANYGYWNEDIENLKQAGDNMMKMLLSPSTGKEKRILDVACGKGESTAYLAAKYSPESIAAINISKNQVEHVRAKVPGADVRVMDAAELEYPDNHFDGVICVEAAFHFQTRQRFFSSAHRVLKPGGWISLADILLSREAEAGRRFRVAENFVPDLPAYEEGMKQAGFVNTTVQDVTEPCFHGLFRYMVHYFHERFLEKKIDLDTVKNRLRSIYGHAEDLRYYLLASGMKPGV